MHIPAITNNTNLRFLKTVFAILVFTISHISYAQDNALSEEEKSQGWLSLFNGKDMSQWRNFKRATLSEKWQVENGTMRLSEKGAGDIITKNHDGIIFGQ